MLGVVRRWVPAALLPVVALIASLAVGPVSASAAPPAGPLRISLDTDIDYVDPALSWYTLTWQLEYATCAKLVNYPDRPAPEGLILQPEIAANMPTVTADGRTYTFEIRGDYTFSPPSNERVTAQSLKATIERTLHPNMSSPAQSFMRDIVGAVDYMQRRAPSISGIVAQGSTLTFTLTDPAGDFLARLALPFFCALPGSTPINPYGIPAPVPSAGPYYISAWEPNRRIVASRNPNYTGNRPRRFDSIEYDIGLPLETIRQNIEAGITDYGPVPSTAHADLGPRYGSGSPAATAGRQQYFVNTEPSFRYLALNTERSLFANANMRKAVNYAIDRPALLAQYGAYAGAVTDQYVPPNVPGFLDAAIYPLSGPDVARARQLAGWNPGDPLRPAVLYTCNRGPCIPAAQIIQANLREMGLDVDIRPFPRAVQFTKAGTRGEPFDLTYEGWHADYLDPWDFIFLMDGTTIRPANNLNFSYFNDPVFNQRMHDAQRLSGDARFQTFGQLDVDLARDGSPLAAFMNGNSRDFFSSRIGCHVYHSFFGMNLSALCLRPEVTVDDTRVAETLSGTATARFTVSLGSAEPDAVTVEYATADGSATAPVDYTATSGRLSFPPGERSKTVDVQVKGDRINELDETFGLQLSNPSKGTITRERGEGTILNARGTKVVLPRCTVPRVTGRTLRKARVAIRRAHCRVGRVRRARSRRVRRGRVVSQRPRAGTRLRVGGRVNLVVSRGR